MHKSDHSTMETPPLWENLMTGIGSLMFWFGVLALIFSWDWQGINPPTILVAGILVECVIVIWSIVSRDFIFEDDVPDTFPSKFFTAGVWGIMLVIALTIGGFFALADMFWEDKRPPTP